MIDSVKIKGRERLVHPNPPQANKAVRCECPFLQLICILSLVGKFEAFFHYGQTPPKCFLARLVPEVVPKQASFGTPGDPAHVRQPFHHIGEGPLANGKKLHQMVEHENTFTSSLALRNSDEMDKIGTGTGCALRPMSLMGSPSSTAFFWWY